jgi:hypothetical protein
MYKSIFAILLFVSISISAQIRKYSNDFLTIGVGAESLAKSNSIIAGIDDVTAGYWNPSGLNKSLYNWDFAFMHAEYFAGLANYDYLGFAKKNENSVIGLSIIRFGVDGIQNTTDLIDASGNFDFNRVTLFSAADYAFLFSMAKNIFNNKISIGGNAKIIYRHIGKFASAYGFGIDFGAQYSLNKWNFGFVAKDISTTFNFWTFNKNELIINVSDSIYNLPPENSLELTLPSFIIGIKRNFEINNNFILSSELDLDITTDGKRNALISFNPLSLLPHIGLEVGYKKIVFIRGGCGNFQKIKIFDKENISFQPSIGLGIKFKGLAIDYALTDIGDKSIKMYSHVFSLRFGFNTLKLTDSWDKFFN